MRQLIPILAAWLGGCDVQAEAEAKNPPEPSESRWIDPVTTKNWSVSQAPVTWDEANEACSGAFRLADTSELRMARARGACDTRTCGFIWSLAVTKDDALALDTTTGKAVVRKKTETGSVFCFER